MKQCGLLEDTLFETNIAPENGWLEYYVPIGEAYFQGLYMLVLGKIEHEKTTLTHTDRMLQNLSSISKCL